MAFSKLTNCWKLFYDWITCLISKNPPDNSKNDEASPAKKPSLVYSIGPCGGIGGAENNMAADPTTRIVKVMVCHGRLLDAIRIMHLHDGVSAWTDWWGVIGGQSSEIALEDDEHLTCVSGHISIESAGSVVIGSLSFASNKRTYGPYGEAAGTPFNLDAQGGKIVGFFGRSGSDLNAIGIYTTPQ